MTKYTIGAFIALFCLMSSCASQKSGWRLSWQEEFGQKGNFDSRVWSKIPRGTADWNNYMSDLDTLYAVRKGNLILRGIQNQGQVNDTAAYLTGGLYTKGKQTFMDGRLEIRARLFGAKGAWPAFWLLPEHSEWPKGGEIDIMERLNYDTLAYQTVHSHYTYTLKQGSNPPQGGTGPIRPDEFNVYAATLYPDSVVLSINGKTTLCYPRIDTDKRGQFPFYTPQYLLIDMQLGGDWVGKVHPEDLPVEMEIDWVRHYKPKGRKHER